MVDEFFGNNNMPARMAFNERAMYKEHAMSSLSDLNLTDFLYKNPWYGKVDRQGYVITPDESLLVQYDSSYHCLGLNFVVDAFQDFESGLLSRIVDAMGIRDFGSRFVNFEVKSAWSSVEENYFNHQNTIYESLYSEIFSDHKTRRKLCNFKNFVKYYFGFLETIASSTAITKIAYVKTGDTGPACSGLTLDLATNTDAGDDVTKKNDYIDDKLFEFFVRGAAEYGFSIDVNVPWRLVARLDSPLMERFLSQRGFTLENLFDKAYNRVYKVQYDDFKTTTLQYYNTFVSSFGEEFFPSYSQEGKMFTKKITREYATSVSLEQLPEIFWLEKYFYFRNLEARVKLSRAKHKRLVKDIFTFYKKNNIEDTLTMMEKRFIKMHPLALPSTRKEYFNYGYLNPETNLYSGKIKKPFPTSGDEPPGGSGGEPGSTY